MKRLGLIMLLALAACGDESSVGLTMDSGAGGGGLDGSMTVRDAAVDAPPDAAVDAAMDAAVLPCDPTSSDPVLVLLQRSAGEGSFVGPRVFVDAHDNPFVLVGLDRTDLVEEQTVREFYAVRLERDAGGTCAWSSERLLARIAADTIFSRPLVAAYDGARDAIAVATDMSLCDAGVCLTHVRVDEFSLTPVSGADVETPLTPLRTYDSDVTTTLSSLSLSHAADRVFVALRAATFDAAGYREALRLGSFSVGGLGPDSLETLPSAFDSPAEGVTRAGPLFVAADGSLLVASIETNDAADPSAGESVVRVARRAADSSAWQSTHLPLLSWSDSEGLPNADSLALALRPTSRSEFTIVATLAPGSDGPSATHFFHVMLDGPAAFTLVQTTTLAHESPAFTGFGIRLGVGVSETTTVLATTDDGCASSTDAMPYGPLWSMYNLSTSEPERLSARRLVELSARTDGTSFCGASRLDTVESRGGLLWAVFDMNPPESNADPLFEGGFYVWREPTL